MPESGEADRAADGTPEFKFRVFGPGNGWEVLAFGHSHPPRSGHGMPGIASGGGSTDDDKLSPKDIYLNEFGPMVLISPGFLTGHDFDNQGRPYKSWDEVSTARLR